MPFFVKTTRNPLNNLRAILSVLQFGYKYIKDFPFPLKEKKESGIFNVKDRLVIHLQKNAYHPHCYGI